MSLASATIDSLRRMALDFIGLDLFCFRKSLELTRQIPRSPIKFLAMGPG